MSKLRPILIALCLMCTPLVLAGCNTIQGAGEDIKETGEEISETSEAVAN